MILNTDKIVDLDLIATHLKGNQKIYPRYARKLSNGRL